MLLFLNNWLALLEKLECIQLSTVRITIKLHWLTKHRQKTWFLITWLTILTAHSSISQAEAVEFRWWNIITVKETALISNTSDISKPVHLSGVRKSIYSMISSSSSRQSSCLHATRALLGSPWWTTTQCPPYIYMADFNTSISICTSLQSDRSLSAGCLTYEYNINIAINH